MDNIRQGVDIKFVRDNKRAIKWQSRPDYKRKTIFNKELTALHFNIFHIKFDKLIHAGTAILDLSKLHMYKFFYKVILPLWPDAEIIGYDTDTFFLYIPTEKKLV